jgi:hypothetical protein
MFGVAGVARFIEPDGWAVWVALALILVGIMCWLRVVACFRQIERDGRE